MTSTPITLHVNGHDVALDVAPRTHLADALREECGLTGTHLGCEQGVCGACTMMIDGAPQRGCLTLAASCAGVSVTTIEGFDDDPVMASLREMFSLHHALQCGYCTPGMLMTAHDIIHRLPDADETRIRQELAGNLCRCTGYAGVVQAIKAVLAEYPVDHPMRQAASAAHEVPPPLPVSSSVEQVPPATMTRPPPLMPDGDGRIQHQLDLDLTPSALWAVLVDVETVAACFPGASLSAVERGEDPAGPHRLHGRLAVSLGPMRAGFEGTGELRFDRSRDRGSLGGEGEDRQSRSCARGLVDFQVEPRGDASRLTLSIAYDVTGPLAQFSRGALVGDLVQTLLQRFAENVAGAARGRPAEVNGELKALSLASAIMRRRLGLWFQRLRSLFRHRSG